MILGLCSEPEILELFRLIKIVIGIIRVAVPVILIFTMTITLMQAVSGGSDNDIVGAKNKFIVRAIASAFIFFIPSLVSIVIGIAGGEDGEAKMCLSSATPDGISKAWDNKASNYVNIVNKTLSIVDYNNAKMIVYRLDNNAKRLELDSELNRLKEYVDIMSELSSLNEKVGYKKFKELKTKIDNVSDEEAKGVLMDKFDEVKETLLAFIGEYPIVPFGEDELYTSLKQLKYDTLSNVLEKNDSSVEELNEKIKLAVEFYGVGTRKATVAAAITLIGSVAETGYQLPYYWGGKRYKLGVDGTWGIFKDNPWCNDYYYDTQEEIDRCKKYSSNWAMDCSGFVNWAIIQGTQKEETQSKTNTGTKVKLGKDTADKAVCEIGDALETNGHIVLVVGIDEVNKRYIVAEESYGLEIKSRPFHGENGSYWCKKLDHNYVD